MSCWLKTVSLQRCTTIKRIMNSRNLLLLAIGLALAACTDRAQRPAAPQEDTEAKRLLQGVWVNEENQNVAFQAKGDTIFYPDSTSQPVFFQIFGDTIVMHGQDEVRYPIIRQTAHLFKFRNQNNEEVTLTKSTDRDDSALFTDRHTIALNQNRLIKRDTIVTHGTDRYHSYVQVNPTTYKVIKTSYNDEGVAVDRFYYDNIVNLHVYHGSRKLFSSDFKKQHFASKVPGDILEQSVLSDIELTKADDRGIHYVASLVIPDTMSSFEVELTIDYGGRLSMSVN